MLKIELYSINASILKWQHSSVAVKAAATAAAAEVAAVVAVAAAAAPNTLADHSTDTML